jgi:hypothetical protein
MNVTAHANLRRKPMKVRDWRLEMNHADVVLFESIAGRTLTEFGYDRAVPRVSLPARMRARWIRMTMGIWRASRRASKAFRRIRGRRSRSRVRRSEVGVVLARRPTGESRE